MPAVRRDRGAHLALHRRVARQEREVAVGRAAGDDLDRAALLEPPEPRHQIGTERTHEVLERSAVEPLPALGERGEPRFAGAREPGAVLGRGGDLLLQVAHELAVEIGVRELLAQDRAQIEGDAERAALRALMQHAPQRQVRLGRRLVEPVDAVGPSTVVEHPGQVGVKDERQAAERHVANSPRARSERDRAPRGAFRSVRAGSHPFEPPRNRTRSRRTLG